MAITPGPTTAAACGDESFGDLFVIGLTSADAYSIANNELTLSSGDGATLQFK
jgi:hypothetical protein